MEWKELEINNIPSDFFVNERYEWLVKDHSNEDYRKPIMETYAQKLYVPKNLDSGIKYRYRLKPLEPIRITNDMFHYLLKDSKIPFTRLDDGYVCSNTLRKIEIIEE